VAWGRIFSSVAPCRLQKLILVVLCCFFLLFSMEYAILEKNIREETRAFFAFLSGFRHIA
jgi:hypothetical protein